MRNKPRRQSAFFRVRVAVALTFCSAGIFLGLAAFAQAQKAADPKGDWPVLRDQLAQEYLGRKVQPGSALEDLIRQNQDFSMLSARESDKRRLLPPWLRVWWRKAHPEGNYSANDPTGGYPHVLNEILEW